MNKPPDEIEMDALFQEWRDKRNCPFFSNDGILCREEWDRALPKIAFLLKEPNDGFYETRGKSFTPGPGSSSPVFWQNLNIWAYTVARFYAGVIPTFEDAYHRSRS